MKLDPNKRAEEIYIEIVEFEKELNSALENSDRLNGQPAEEQIIIFFGDAPYPNRNVKNISAFTIYKRYNFNEVAFLCNVRKLELFSIVGIMCGSFDVASKLVGMLLANNKMDIFAKFLWYKKRTLLINVNNNSKNVDSLLKNYQNHKVMMCCGCKYKIKKFNTLNKKKTNRKYDNIFLTNHPGHRAYIKGSNKCCQTYLEMSYQDKASNLTLKQFQIF